jgi:N-acetylglucosaminyldiphosphoundecaprenol N-acetyl-beta-D-mannosaminyltransferase
MNTYPYIKLLGYNIFSGDKDFFSNSFSGIISTMNPHSHIIACKDPVFMRAIRESDLVIPDGSGIVMAARFIKGEKIRKIAGSDLHEIILKSLNKRGGKSFYLGSSDATLLHIKERLRREMPSIVAGFFSPPFKTEFNKDDNKSMIKAVNEFNPEVLFVGMTAPKQEKWVHENKHLINARVICSIGAVFDFYAGTKKRPGKFWIKTGLEWLPRFIREPGRLWQRNLISTPLFIYYVIREKFKK